jgi:hypothetical protein
MLFGQRCARHADLSYAASPSAFLVGVGRDIGLESLAAYARHAPVHPPFPQRARQSEAPG